MKKQVVLLCLLLVSFGVYAQRDSVRVSLLTCAPGTEIYELFGHTALRYEDMVKGEDLVFNYGVFSFGAPNFVLRYIKGETDYRLGIVPYSYFEGEYALRGSSVYQQVLNLTLAEKQKMLKLLLENYRPENRVYRYNNFYNNCTTRARDKIEECIDGKIIYPDGKDGMSFRKIVRQCTESSAWGGLGIDLCLGSEADVVIDGRKQMFAPFNMLTAARGAVIVKGDSVRPLVLDETKIVDVEPNEVPPSFPLSPMACVLILLVVACVIVWWQLRMKRIVWVWDLVLFGVQGIAGCIIAFLFFFSIHPTVDSNWLIVLLNPIPLIYLPVMIKKDIKGKKDPYHLVNVGCLTLFIMIIPFVQQEFHITVLPLALCLLICSAGHILFYRQNNK